VKLFGIQTIAEKVIESAEHRLFFIFHRKVFCLMDSWYGLTMEDIREIENELKQQLNILRTSVELRGMTL
jgi:hypothetical protein